MTTNNQMEIRFYKALPKSEPYNPRIMPVIVPAETVCIELPDGTMLSGVVTSEWDEITGQSRITTKTIRVHGIALGGAR